MKSPGLSDGSWSWPTSGSPTNYQDPFLRGEGPFEAGDTRLREAAGQMPIDLGMLQGHAFGGQPKPYIPRQLRQRPRFTFCVFCKNNGEDERLDISLY